MMTDTVGPLRLVYCATNSVQWLHDFVPREHGHASSRLLRPPKSGRMGPAYGRRPLHTHAPDARDNVPTNICVRLRPGHTGPTATEGLHSQSTFLEQPSWL